MTTTQEIAQDVVQVLLDGKAHLMEYGIVRHTTVMSTLAMCSTGALAYASGRGLCVIGAGEVRFFLDGLDDNMDLHAGPFLLAAMQEVSGIDLRPSFLGLPADIARLHDRYLTDAQVYESWDIAIARAKEAAA